MREGRRREVSKEREIGREGGGIGRERERQREGESE